MHLDIYITFSIYIFLMYRGESTTPCLFSCASFKGLNPLTAKLFNLNFHPLEVVSEQVRFGKMEVNSFQILLVDVTFYL